MLTDSANTFSHFSAQVKLREQKANHLLDASTTLKKIIAEITDDKSIPWKMIIEFIEVYRMTQHLEHAWVKEIFTPEELKQYIDFETELKANATPEKKAAFEKNWANLISEISKHLEQDPKSVIGIMFGKKFMDWVNSVYGKKYAHLRTKKFESGFAKGKGLTDVGLTSEMVSWIDKAMDAYWRDRIDAVLNQVGTGVADEKILNQWNEILDDMYGEDNARKREICAAALADEKISEKAKKWLKKFG